MKNIHKEKFLIKSVNTKHAPYHNGLVVKTRKKASVHFSFCYIFIYSSLIIFFINLILKEKCKGTSQTKQTKQTN